MAAKIYILTGAIQSGKTTKLIQWSNNRNDVFGILTPAMNGKKVFMDANSREQFSMEAGPEEKDILTIGRYTFSKTSFEKAITILQKAIKEKSGWLLVDEIGPLELRGEGFHNIVKEILNSKTALNILFVIRDTILDEALKFYGLNIKGVTVIDKDADFLSPL